MKQVNGGDFHFDTDRKFSQNSNGQWILEETIRMVETRKTFKKRYKKNRERNKSMIEVDLRKTIPQAAGFECSTQGDSSEKYQFG